MFNNSRQITINGNSAHVERVVAGTRNSVLFVAVMTADNSPLTKLGISSSTTSPLPYSLKLRRSSLHIYIRLTTIFTMSHIILFWHDISFHISPSPFWPSTVQCITPFGFQLSLIIIIIQFRSHFFPSNRVEKCRCFPFSRNFPLNYINN